CLAVIDVRNDRYISNVFSGISLHPLNPRPIVLQPRRALCQLPSQGSSCGLLDSASGSSNSCSNWRAGVPPADRVFRSQRRGSRSAGNSSQCRVAPLLWSDKRSELRAATGTSHQGLDGASASPQASNRDLLFATRDRPCGSL